MSTVLATPAAERPTGGLSAAVLHCTLSGTKLARTLTAAVPRDHLGLLSVSLLSLCLGAAFTWMGGYLGGDTEDMR